MEFSPHRYSPPAGPLTLDLVMVMGFVAIAAPTDGGGGGTQCQLKIGPRRAAAHVLICTSFYVDGLDIEEFTENYSRNGD